MKKILLCIFGFLSSLLGAQQWQWAKIADSTQQNISLNCLAVDNSGNFYLTTNFVNNFGESNGASIVKFDSQGNAVWRRDLIGTIGISGISYKNNKICLTGYFKNVCQIDNDTIISSGGTDIYASVLTSNGSFIWTKRFGGSQDDFGNGVCADVIGNFYLTGSYSGTASFGTSNLVCQGALNMFMMKIDFFGNILILKSAGCFDTTGSSGTKIRTDVSGNIFILGGYKDITLDTIHVSGDHYYGSHFLCKLDATGSTQWVRSAISGTDHLSDLAIDQSGDIVASGQGSWTNGGWTITRKYNSAGLLLWSRTITGSCYGDDYSSGSITMENNNSYLIGTAGRNNCVAPHFKTLLRIKFDSMGNIVFRDSTLEQTTAPNGCIGGTQIVMDSNGDFIICGVLAYGGIVLGSDSLSAINAKVFIAKFYGNNVTYLDRNIEHPEAIQIYPNPTVGTFSVDLRKYRDACLSVSDVFGKCLLKKDQNDAILQIDLASQPKGIYFVEIMFDGEKVVKKIILQ